MVSNNIIAGSCRHISIFRLAYAIGKGAAAGASALGLGALCYYGLGMGKGTSVLNNSL